MSTMVPAKKNTEYIFYTSLASQAYPYTFQDNPTLAVGDVKVAVDDAAPTNIINLPEVDADFTKRVKVTLTASEMNGDNITIIFSDVAGDEWCDHVVNIQTTAAQIDEIKSETADILADTAEIGTAGAGLTAIPWNSAWDAEVQSECADALNSYDPPTKAEMDSGFAGLNDPSAADIADAVWDESTSEHTTADTFGAKNQNVVPSETIDDYKADVSTLALEANVQGHCTAALTAYDPPTKAEMDSAESNIRGADNDTLKTLSDQIDGVAPAGEYDTEMSRIDQSLSTTESNIRGTDNDDLKTLSDQLDGLENLSQDEVIAAMWTKTVINKSTGTFTVYKANGIDVLITGTITASASKVTRSVD